MRFMTVCMSVLILFVSGTVMAASIDVDHSATAEFDEIPTNIINDISTGYRIYYGHTSHGSQVMSGLAYLQGENSLYDFPTFHEVADDLGHNGDTSWAPGIRSWLNTHPDYNMVMMSWCLGVSDNTAGGINIYLNKMNQLETAYPGVTFVYMTGHLDGTGPSGNLYQMNNLIRDYCSTHNKILYDFADIESWDPDGNYYPNEDDGCDWCSSWCATHDCCSGICAHSHCFNCYQKGKAWWWMMATIEGWSMALDVDENATGGLPQTYSLEQNYPNPFKPGYRDQFLAAGGGGGADRRVQYRRPAGGADSRWPVLGRELHGDVGWDHQRGCPGGQRRVFLSTGGR